MIIARLTAELRCYVPYLPEGPWARQVTCARRDGLLSRVTAAREQLRDLLECAWPAMLETAAEPLESLTWRAALAVSADPAVIAAMSEQQFHDALRGQLHGLGGRKVWRRIALAIHAAAHDPGGIAAERSAILERAAFAYQDWMSALADIDSRMVAVLGELDLTRLVTTIPGLTAVGAAVILAETGDPGPLLHPTRVGQARGPGAAGQRVRQVPRPDPQLGPWPPGAAHGGVAGDLGRASLQPGLSRPAGPSHQPRRQPPH